MLLGMTAEKIIALLHSYQEACDEYHHARQAACEKANPTAAEVQRVEDARVLFEAAKRAYFGTL
jgi:hypothetical protein